MLGKCQHTIKGMVAFGTGMPVVQERKEHTGRGNDFNDVLNLNLGGQFTKRLLFARLSA